jgi:putative Holliday junction resolvase
MALEGRVVGLDVGDVRTGVAVSDPMRIVATPRVVIDTSSPDAGAQAIAEIVREEEAALIVVGVPLDREGKRGHQAEKVQSFVDRLGELVEVEIVFQDERFTTAAAQRAMKDAGVKPKKRKKIVDKLAAQQILQAYLDRQAFKAKQQS